MRKIGQIFSFLIPVIALVALVVFMTGAGIRRRAKLKEMKAKYDLMHEAWNTGNADLLDEVHARDIVRHGPGSPWVEEDFEGVKQRLLNTHKEFPGLQITTDEIIIEGDRSADRYTMRAPLKNGKELVVQGACVHHWVDGEIVEVWEYADWLGLYQQLGYKLVPPEEQGGK